MKSFAAGLLLMCTVLSQLSHGQHFAASPGQDSLTRKLDDYLAAAHAAYKFTGTALVAKGDRVLLHKAYGNRDYTRQAPNDTTTRFPILSITKPFTAMVMLRLQEQGKLSLDDKLSQYLPDFPHGEQIKLHHLITHSSGLHNFTEDIGEEDSMIVCYPVTRQRVLDVFKDRPLTYKPGKNAAYNNSGFFLAGMVIEKATSQPYEQVVRDMIFRPLGMHHSGFDYINLPAASRAQGYQCWTAQGHKPYRHYDSTVAYAAGSIYSTTGDLYKWARAIAGRKILSADSWKMAFKRQIGEYSHGFILGAFGGKQFVRHAGGYPGFMSEFIYFPREDLTIILLNNYGNYDDSLWPIVMACSNVVLGKPYDLWVARKEVQLEESVLKQYTGSFGSKKKPIKFFLQDGRLVAKLTGGHELPMLAEAEDSFYFSSYNTSFRFRKDSTGKVDKVSIQEHGQEFILPKLE
jgi:CubicO group peptidase (beta-lactamase class C family)